MLGSVAERVARTAPCSVVTIGLSDKKPSRPRRILVGTDFSEAADHAIDAAVTLAAALGAVVTIVHAYEVPPEGFPAELHEANPDTLAAYARRSTQSLEDAAAGRRASGVEIHTALRKANASDGIAIAADAAGADLVVVGTHGRSGLRRWLLGSVAERVIRTSPQPVLVVRS
jgi:nucleotide-binding universal stress UspA family protein